ncbi:MAG: hypothetical protein U0Y96_04060 [Candidatus Kapaibacterium sp.]
MSTFCRRLFLVVAFTCTTQVYAMIPEGSTINFLKTFEELEHGTPEMHNSVPTIYFKNITLKFNRDIDNVHDIRYEKGGQAIHVKYAVMFDNCTISDDFWYLLRNVVFEDRVSFIKCTDLRLKFRECTFKQVLIMVNNGVDFTEFHDCTFENGVRFIRQEVRDHITLNNCTLTVNPYLVRNPGFDTVKYVIRKTSEFPQILEFINRTNPVDLEITKCTFLLPSEYKNDARWFVDLGTSIYNNLRFMNNVCYAPVKLAQSTIQNQFMCYGCDFRNVLLLEAFSFNTVAAKVQWSQLEGKKIAIQSPDTKQFITGNSAAELKDEFLYSTLVTAYSTFYAAFKSQGNMLSANRCYIEWKDIETIFLSHEVENNFTLNRYFNWLMNVFLRTFCDYGANPVKALFWSAWVMIVFAIIYFFMPYQSGLYARESFFQKVRIYMDYFAQNKTLLQLFNENAETVFTSTENYREYRQYCEDNKVHLPWYFTMFNRQIFSFEVFKYKRKQWLIRKLSNITGLWKTRHGIKKFLIGATIAVIVFSTIFITVLIRFIDASTTSLNAFSTLGFGEIPVLGIARYLAVIEGFVGWFLLSIFSVALISQVIQ